MAMGTVNARIAIIGGGPAGASTAICAAQAFIGAGRDPSSIVILEGRDIAGGQTHNTEKVCGGCVMSDGLRFMRERLGLDPDGIPHVPIHRVVISDGGFLHAPWKDGRTSVSVDEPGWAYIYHRKDLDAALFKRAQDLGVTVLFGHRAARVMHNGRGIFRVEARDAREGDARFVNVATRMLVGAYGANARLQRQFFRIMDASLDPQFDFTALAYRFIGDAAPQGLPPHAQRVSSLQYRTPDGRIDSAYVWDWPAPGGRSNKGFGFSRVSHAKQARDASTVELAKRVFPGDARGLAGAAADGLLTVRGGLLPIYHPDSIAEVVIRGGGVIAVCGDAAGRINPVTGEGIAEALEDGALGFALAQSSMTGTFEAVRRYVARKPFLTTEVYRRLSHVASSMLIQDPVNYRNFVDAMLKHPAAAKIFTTFVRRGIPARAVMSPGALRAFSMLVKRNPRMLRAVPGMLRAAYRARGEEGI